MIQTSVLSRCSSPELSSQGCILSVTVSVSERHKIIWLLLSSLLKHDLPTGRAGCRGSGFMRFSKHPKKEFFCFSETGQSQDLIIQPRSSLKWDWGGTTASISTEGNRRNFPTSTPLREQCFTPWVTSHYPDFHSTTDIINTWTAETTSLLGLWKGHRNVQWGKQSEK